MFEKLNKKSLLRIISGLAVFSLLMTVTALALFLSQGQTFGEQGEIVQIGILRINSTPKDVEVFLDGEKKEIRNNSIEISKSGKVTLRLEKSGYSTWEKIVNVSSGIIQDVYAQLFPNTFDVEALVEKNIDRVFYSPNPDVIFYTLINEENNKNNGIWKLKLTRTLLDFSEISPTQVAYFDESMINFLKINDYKITPSSNNSKLLLETLNEKSIYLFDTTTPDSRTDIIKSVGFSPEQISWYKDSQALLVLKNKFLFEYSLQTNELLAVTFFEQETPIFAHNQNSVFFLMNKKIYVYKNFEVTEIELNSQLVLPDTIYSISTMAQIQNAFVLRTNKGLIFVDTDKSFYEVISTDGEALFVQMSEGGNTIIYSVGGQLYSFYIEEDITPKTFVTKKGEINLSLGEVNSIIISATGRNLIYEKSSESGQGIFLSDFDGGNAVLLIDGESIKYSSFQISRDLSELYFSSKYVSQLASSLGGIFKLELVVEK